MPVGPGGMSQSGGHASSNLNDNMAPGIPPTSMMQGQMSNGEKCAFYLLTLFPLLLTPVKGVGFCV